MDTASVLARIDELERLASSGPDVLTALHGSFSLAEILRGRESQTVAMFRKQVNESYPDEKRGLARSILSTLRGEVEAGLIGNLRAHIAGSVLADFVALSRGALAEGVVNVAAVLAAAAFEDTIRRMGEELAGVHSRPNLADVLTKLKQATVIEGPQVGIAQAYLKFRNDALHADWEQIDRAGIESCLGFVEQLLMIHFAR